MVKVKKNYITNIVSNIRGSAATPSNSGKRASSYNFTYLLITVLPLALLGSLSLILNYISIRNNSLQTLAQSSSNDQKSESTSAPEIKFVKNELIVVLRDGVSSGFLTDNVKEGNRRISKDVKKIIPSIDEEKREESLKGIKEEIKVILQEALEETIVDSTEPAEKPIEVVPEASEEDVDDSNTSPVSDVTEEKKETEDQPIEDSTQPVIYEADEKSTNGPESSTPGEAIRRAIVDVEEWLKSGGIVEGVSTDLIKLQMAEYLTEIDEIIEESEDPGEVLNNTFVVKLDKEYSLEELEKVALELKENKNVLWVVPNIELTINNTPNDPLFDQLWGMKKIEAEKAWDKVTDASSIVVADIDTGVNYKHEDLKDNMWVNWAELVSHKDNIVDVNGNSIVDCEDLFDSQNSFVNDGNDDDDNGYVDDYCGWDFYNHDNNPMDDNSHGTHTVGTIAAMGNNGKGVVGVSWKAKIMAIKAFSSGGSSNTAVTTPAMKYAADMGARLSSNSWSGAGNLAFLNELVTYNINKNTAVIAAAGNSSLDTLAFFPAGLSGVFTVGASDQSDNKAGFSNYGDKLDVVAPGVGVLSTVLGNNGYGSKSGTSMATPHAAGVFTLVLGKYPDLHVEQVRQVIRKGAKDLGNSGKDKSFGYGRLDVSEALEYAEDHQDLPAPFITYPVNGQNFTGHNVSEEIEVKGKIYGNDFKKYKIFMHNGSEYKEIADYDEKPVDDVLGKFRLKDLSDSLPNGLKVVAYDNDDNDFEFEIYNLLKDNLNLSMNIPPSVGAGRFDITGYVRLQGGLSLDHYEILWKKASDGNDKYSNEGITLTNNGTSVVNSGRVGTWDTSKLESGQEYSILIRAETTDGDGEEIEYKTVVSKDVAAGWPITISGGYYVSQYYGYAPGLADLDGDGNKEIIFAFEKNLYVYNKDGSLKPGFPVSISGLPQEYNFIRPVNVADLNRDGKKEIIVVAYQDVLPESLVYVIDYTGKNVSGWPQKFTIDNKIFDDNTPIAVKRGVGNTRDLVFYTSPQVSGSMAMNVYSYDGKVQSGFPKQVAPNDWWHGSFSASDVDLDGSLEFSIVNGGNKLYSFDLYGNLKQGYPVSVPNDKVLDSGVVYGDVAGDGMLELLTIVSPKGCFNPCSKELYAYDYLGRLAAGYPRGYLVSYWPQTMYFPTLGNMDSTGKEEYAQDPNIFNVPLFDVGDDKGIDKLYMESNYKYLQVKTFSGQTLWKTPPLTFHMYERIWPQVVSDVDNNQRYDVSFLAGNYLYLLEIPLKAGKLEWPLYLHDEMRSGNVHTPIDSYQSDPIAPSAQFINPTNNAEFFGKSKVTIRATDNSKVKHVILKVLAERPDLSNPVRRPLLPEKTWVLNSNTDIYELELDFTSTFPIGSYQTFVTYAVDDNGNAGPRTGVNFRVSNFIPTFVTIENPKNGQTISNRPINLSGKAGGTNGIKALKGRRCVGPTYTVCSAYIGLKNVGGTWSFSDNYPIWNGTWKYQVVAADNKNNVVTAEIIIIYGPGVITLATPVTPPLYVTIDSPVRSQILSRRPIVLNGRAGGGNGVASLVGRRCAGTSFVRCSNWVPLGYNTNGTWSFADNYPITNGIWTYQVVVKDKKGVSSSATVAVGYRR